MVVGPPHPQLLTSEGSEAFDLLQQRARPGREGRSLPASWIKGIRGHRGSWQSDLPARPQGEEA